MAEIGIPQNRPVVTYSQAKEGGLTRYWTGKPCKHGHIAERMAINGQCYECSRIKQRRARAADPETARQRYREWKAANPLIAKAATDRWRTNNPDKVAVHQKRKYLRHRSEYLAKQAIYSAKNSKRIVERVKLWCIANPDKARQNHRNWNARHPEQVRANTLLQASRRKAAEGRFTATDVGRIYKDQKGKCAYCRCSLKDSFHIDHITPIKRGGTNWPANLQLCCVSCNCRKSASDPVAYAQSLGRLL